MKQHYKHDNVCVTSYEKNVWKTMRWLSCAISPSYFIFHSMEDMENNIVFLIS